MPIRFTGVWGVAWRTTVNRHFQAEDNVGPPRIRCGWPNQRAHITADGAPSSFMQEVGRSKHTGPAAFSANWIDQIDAFRSPCDAARQRSPDSPASTQQFSRLASRRRNRPREARPKVRRRICSRRSGFRHGLFLQQAVGNDDHRLHWRRHRDLISADGGFGETYRGDTGESSRSRRDRAPSKAASCDAVRHSTSLRRHAPPSP